MNNQRLHYIVDLSGLLFIHSVVETKPYVYNGDISDIEKQIKKLCLILEIDFSNNDLEDLSDIVMGKLKIKYNNSITYIQLGRSIAGLGMIIDADVATINMLTDYLKKDLKKIMPTNEIDKWLKYIILLSAKDLMHELHNLIDKYQPIYINNANSNESIVGKRESIDKYIKNTINNYNGEVTMGNKVEAGRDITGVAIGNHNKIDVKITTTNKELENLLDELKAEINQIKAKLSDTDKTKIDKILARLEEDVNDKDIESVGGHFERISKIASIVEGAGKILEYKEKIIEFLGFGG